MSVFDVLALWTMGGFLGYLIRATRQIRHDEDHASEIAFLENYVATLQTANDDLGRRLKLLQSSPHPSNPTAQDLIDSWFTDEGE